MNNLSLWWLPASICEVWLRDRKVLVVNKICFCTKSDPRSGHSPACLVSRRRVRLSSGGLTFVRRLAQQSARGRVIGGCRALDRHVPFDAGPGELDQVPAAVAVPEYPVIAPGLVELAEVPGDDPALPACSGGATVPTCRAASIGSCPVSWRFLMTPPCGSRPPSPGWRGWARWWPPPRSGRAACTFRRRAVPGASWRPPWTAWSAACGGSGGRWTRGSRNRHWGGRSSSCPRWRPGPGAPAIPLAAPRPVRPAPWRRQSTTMSSAYAEARIMPTGWADTLLPGWSAVRRAA